MLASPGEGALSAIGADHRVAGVAGASPDAFERDESNDRVKRDRYDEQRRSRSMRKSSLRRDIRVPAAKQDLQDAAAQSRDSRMAGRRRPPSPERAGAGLAAEHVTAVDDAREPRHTRGRTPASSGEASASTSLAETPAFRPSERVGRRGRTPPFMRGCRTKDGSRPRWRVPMRRVLVQLFRRPSSTWSKRGSRSSHERQPSGSAATCACGMSSFMWATSRMNAARTSAFHASPIR
jgi:hypothetical protein